MDGDTWIPISEAARRLGVTRTAIRNKMKRGSLPTHTDNHGQLMTRVSISGVDTLRVDTSRYVSPPVATPEAYGTAESMPLSLHREVLEALQAADEQHRRDMADERARHLGEIERMQVALTAMEQRHTAEIARIESRHTAELARFAQTQAAATKVLMDRVGAVLLANRRRAWWRWF